MHAHRAWPPLHAEFYARRLCLLALWPWLYPPTHTEALPVGLLACAPALRFCGDKPLTADCWEEELRQLSVLVIEAQSLVGEEACCQSLACTAQVRLGDKPGVRLVHACRCTWWGQTGQATAACLTLTCWWGMPLWLCPSPLLCLEGA